MSNYGGNIEAAFNLYFLLIQLSDYNENIKKEIASTLNFEEIESDLKKKYTIDELNEIEKLGLKFYKEHTKTIEIFFKPMTKDSDGKTVRAKDGFLYQVFFP